VELVRPLCRRGAGGGTTNFADPFGTSVFGDKASTPAFLAGGQLGYN
jgi:hypothetical protein